jgi:hypothetical protein
MRSTLMSESQSYGYMSKGSWRGGADSMGDEMVVIRVWSLQWHKSEMHVVPRTAIMEGASILTLVYLPKDKAWSVFYIVV